MNLHDLIQPTTTRIKKQDKQYTKEIETMRSFVDNVNTLGLKNIKVYETLDPVIDNLNNKIRQSFFDSFRETFAVPETIDQCILDRQGNIELVQKQLSNSLNEIKQLSKCPKTKISNLLDIADNLGMIIMPVSFLDPISYSNESNFIKSLIWKFLRISDTVDLDTYVLCPLSQYDIIRHVKNSNISQRVYPGKNAQLFETINMMLPLFVMFMDNIDDLNSKFDNFEKSTDAQFKRVNDSITLIKRNLEEVSKKVEAQLLENKRLQEMIKTQTAQRQKSIVNDRLFVMQDPLLFSVRKGTDLLSDKDEVSIVGPCWGGEADDIINALMDVSAIKSQRKVIENRLEKLFR